MSRDSEDQGQKGTPEEREAQVDRLRLLSKLMAKEGMDVEKYGILPLGRTRTEFPLTFAQERLWFLHRLEPTNPAYHIVYAVPMGVDPDLDAMQWALDRLVERHEGFRTSFEDRDGEPVQVIHPPGPTDVSVVDFQSMDDAGRTEAIQDLVNEYATTPFDLDAGNVFRIAIARLDPENCLVVLAVHHIVTDGWSAGLILRDLLALYSVRLQGDPDPLPQLHVQSADFAVWQRDRLKDGPHAKDLGYWKSHLEGIRPLPLPLDHPRPSAPVWNGAAVGCVIDEETTAALTELARDTGATLFQTVLTAFMVLLSRISGRTDIAVGTPVSGHRERPELSQVVGCFLNMLVLRSDFGGSPTFRDALDRVRAAATEGFQRQHVPFEVIVRELRPDRMISQNPLFNVTFTLDQPNPNTSDFLEDKTLAQVVGVDLNTVRFDLEATVVAAEGVLQVGFLFPNELLETATVSRWLDEFQSLLVEIAQDPDRPISQPSRRSEALMSTKELLSHLRSIGVRLWVEGENLRLNAPKGALTDPLKEELSSRKAEILGVLQAAADAEQSAEIKPVPRDGELLASVAQQRLWFLDRLAPGTPVYNIASASRIPRLDESAFSRAFDALIERHEVLRTSFEAGDGAPRLVVHPPTTGNLEVIDLATTPPDEREGLIGSLVGERAQRGFDLSEAPLVRATLIQVNQQESVLVWCVHHIVADGWSLEIITRDLVVLYSGFQSGQPHQLPELPLQYADFAAWQRERIDSPAVQGQLAHWTNKLGGRLPVMELPTDRPRPPIQTMAGARTRLEVPRALADILKALSHEEGVTLFMTLLAAFKVFLFRYTGESDVVVGTPTAGRDHPKLENLVGFFVNNLVLRTDLSGTPTFRELLQRVRRVVLDAHANQEVPFDQLVEVLRPERSMAHPPLFQVMFNSPMAPQKDGGQTGAAEEVEFEVGTARFDLTVEVYDHTGSNPAEGEAELDQKGLTFFFEYNTDLFDRESVAGFQTAYRRLLEELVAGIDLPISLLPLLEEEERTRTLRSWNETGAEYAKDRCFHQVFEDRVAADPSRVAVRAGNESTTFGELDQKAADLAAHLQAMGVGPGSLVGVCVDRSMAMPVSVLAVMKAGGAYVPLDPTYPPGRLQFMMEDSGAAVLLTQSHLEDIIPAGSATTVLIDKEEWTEGGARSGLDPVEMTSDDLVYVIYTSGSTGKPKGVQITHRALLNFLTSMAQEPGMGPEDRLLAVTTLSFDISGLELYLPLMLGAEVVVASRAEALDPMQLAELIESSGATVMQATPATWRLLLKSGWSGSPSLRMLCGGEALERELAEQLLPMGAELWNLYGPTEATIWSSLLRVEEGMTSPVSIGRPIANTEMYILDDHGNPVPVGVAGELFIGGDGLARGYLNRPNLTAERFVEHPFAPGTSRRVYRTGDGARFRRDGSIDFLGRLDTQVKLRGFRIELGEIESNLNGHPSVSESAVTVREDVPGDQRLVAYLVRDGEDDVDSEELQAHLKTSLPDYMIPSSFVVLPSLPLTPNGKVDRRALPAPDGSGAGRRAYEAPETETERAIAQVWQDVLRVEQVGLKDNFFDLGGHSLLAVRVQTLLTERLENPPSLIDLFQFPTVTALAQHVARSDEPSTSNERTRDPASTQQEAGE